MKNKLSLIKKYLQKDSLRKLTRQGLWIGQYARRYWKAMVLYTLLGVMGTGVSLVSSLISKDLVDIITGHETGRLISTFAAMIGFSIGNILVAQASGYASTLINLKVDTEIKNDIFAKMMVTDWESLTTYHTGDLVTRWSSDASNIASGILNWIPNLIIYTVRFISALAIVIYYDPTFAIFALLGIPFSALLSKPLLKRMSKNNQRSAQMNAKEVKDIHKTVWKGWEDVDIPRERKIVELQDAVEEVESCSACYGYLIPALDMLKQEGLFEKLDCKIAVGQGYRGKSGKLGVGNCTCRFEHFVKGCPPTEMEIYEYLKKYLIQY